MSQHGHMGAHIVERDQRHFSRDFRRGRRCCGGELHTRLRSRASRAGLLDVLPRPLVDRLLQEVGREPLN